MSVVPDPTLTDKSTLIQLVTVFVVWACAVPAILLNVYETQTKSSRASLWRYGDRYN